MQPVFVEGPLMHTVVLPLVLFLVCLVGLAAALLLLGNLFGPRKTTPIKRMPYESGMDPIHDTRRRFDVRFYLLAIAFLVFDVELLFLYPWAVVFGARESAGAAEVAAEIADGRPPMIFAGGMVFLMLLVLGFVYDWRKGVFRWR
jgi:NADH-quinone oxidoreductase subunit A